MNGQQRKHLRERVQNHARALLFGKLSPVQPPDPPNIADLRRQIAKLKRSLVAYDGKIERKHKRHAERVRAHRDQLLSMLMFEKDERKALKLVESFEKMR